MDDTRVSTTLDEIIERLRSADWKERDSILAELKSLVEKSGLTPLISRHLEDAKKTLPLEVRWDLDELVEALDLHAGVSLALLRTTGTHIPQYNHRRCEQQPLEFVHLLAERQSALIAASPSMHTGERWNRATHHAT